jgi:hypothetical protein
MQAGRQLVRIPVLVPVGTDGQTVGVEQGEARWV